MKLTGLGAAIVVILMASMTLMALPVQASIIGGQVTGGFSLTRGGQFVLLTVPFVESTPDNTVGQNNFNTPDLYGFDEGQNIMLSADLDVDALADGLGGESGPGSIAAGTAVDSHYIFFDPAGGVGRDQTGNVQFDADILGVIFSGANLTASDAIVNNGVTYLNPARRELEAGDLAWISGLRELSVDWLASNPGDYVRVLTVASVPEPTTGLMMGLATLSLALFGRRGQH